MSVDINLDNVAPKDVADAHYLASNPHSGSQETLVSGANIKTLNGNSLLGAGDLTISSANRSTANTTVTGNRAHNFASFREQWDNIQQFKLTANIAPPLGEASFRFRGFGSTGNDIQFTIRKSDDLGNLWSVGGTGINTLTTDDSGGQILIMVHRASGSLVRHRVSNGSYSILNQSGFGLNLGVNSANGINSQNQRIQLFSQAANTLFFDLGDQTQNPTIARTRVIQSPVASGSTAFAPVSGNGVDYSVQSIGNNVFQPTSGTATYAQYELRPTINQTGSANGLTRALYVNPVLTSAVDFRAIDVETGKIKLPLITYADNASAVTGLGGTGFLYKLADGTVKITI